MRTRSNSYGKKRRKIKENEFEILKPYQFLQFLDYDYNIKQLKSTLKAFGLKISGNKNELNSRVFEYMRFYYFASRIQNNFRSYLLRQFYKIYNTNKFIKHKLYNNDTDFYSMENISNINRLYLLTYNESEKFNWVFKTTSIIKHFETNNYFNPFNRIKFNDEFIKNILYFKNIYKIYPNLSDVEEEEPLFLSNKQKILMQLNNYFHIIDTLGNYSNVKWLTDLSNRHIVIFIRELYDIWNYRAQLSDETKKAICPPNGIPFFNINIHNISRHNDHIYLLEICCQIFNNLLQTEANDSNKSLAALYILSSLTIVSDDAADAMPWLYQSVAIN